MPYFKISYRLRENKLNSIYEAKSLPQAFINFKNAMKNKNEIVHIYQVTDLALEKKFNLLKEKKIISDTGACENCNFDPVLDLGTKLHCENCGFESEK